MDAITKTLTIELDRFYEVINALRDKCGCPRCLENANLLLLTATTNTTFR